MGSFAPTVQVRVAAVGGRRGAGAGGVGTGPPPFAWAWRGGVSVPAAAQAPPELLLPASRGTACGPGLRLSPVCAGRAPCTLPVTDAQHARRGVQTRCRSTNVARGRGRDRAGRRETCRLGVPGGPTVLPHIRGRPAPGRTSLPGHCSGPQPPAARPAASARAPRRAGRPHGAPWAPSLSLATWLWLVGLARSPQRCHGGALRPRLRPSPRTLVQALVTKDRASEAGLQNRVRSLPGHRGR